MMRAVASEIIGEGPWWAPEILNACYKPGASKCCIAQ